MIVNIDDLNRAARRRLPRMFYDYADGGAYDERTLRANRDDFARIGLRQRVLTDLSKRDFSATVLGEDMAWPLMLAPTGFAGLISHRGEAEAAAAGANKNIPFVQSSMSVCSIEEVAETAGRPQWFQLYVMKDRSIAEDMLARLKAVSCPVLVVTVDLTVLGKRERDFYNGSFMASHGLTAKGIADIMRHPRWAFDMLLRGRPWEFGNVKHLPEAGKGVFSQAHFVSHQTDPTLNWDDIAWIRSLWPGKIVLKGILDAEDAREAAKHGVDGIIVSNHGGRQLDGAPSSISVLPDIVDAVGGDLTVLFDGGIRRGSDIVKAIALGADACLIGRAMLYGLGAAGRAGVEKAVDILRGEFELTASLMGLTTYDRLHGNRESLILKE